MDTIVFTHFEIFFLPGQSYSLNIPYYCQKCGLCCSETSFPGSKKEKKDLLIELKKSKGKSANDRITDQDLQKRPCVFLDNKICQIYSQRPILCREWYPRVESKCLASQLHQKMGKLILRNRNYRIGTREVLFIGKPNPNPIYPIIKDLNFIDKNALKEYHFPSTNEAMEILGLLHDFKLSDIEIEIFKAINPIYKYMDQSTSLF